MMLLALLGAAAGIGAVHSCAPDHWMPFAALAGAERWSLRRTAATTALCGIGHVTTSVLLGVLALFFGRALFEGVGRQLESVSGLLLIGFGVAYATWGLRHMAAARLHRHHDGHHHHAHGHHHHHVHHHHDHSRRTTAWMLFLLFSADPCVAVIPLMFASASLGWGSTLAVVAAYELATIATMVLLVLPARAAAASVRGVWADRYGDALAGVVVMLVGVVVTGFGL